MSLEDLLTPDEKALHDALVSIANQYGKFDEDGSGIWAGYESAEENDEKEIGVKCSNCALYMGGVECEILAFEVEAEGKCRFAVIPDGYVDVSSSPEDDMSDDMDQMYKSDNEEEDKWDNIEKKCWVGYKQEGMKEKNGRMVPNCVPVSKSDSEDMSKADINLTPTSGMKSAAARALAWKKEGKRGGTRVGLARANQIVNGTELSESTVARMYSFFSRHEVDKKATGFNSGEEGFPSPGRVAWDLWGGDAGYSWSTAKWNSIKNKRENKSDTVTKSLWSGTPFSGLK
jgi:hypothetical protein